MTSRDVVVDGIPIHYAEAGDGPALLLLHGVSAGHHVWERTIPAFAHRWRVIAPDLPGHGASGKPDAPYTPDFYAGVMRSLGRELGVEEAVVVGNSLGGQVAIELALSYPRWTRAVVLAAPPGGYGTLMRGIVRTIGSVAGARVMRTALPWALDLCFWDPFAPACDTSQRALAERLGADDFADFARAVARSIAGAMASGVPPLRQLTQPTLVVWGRQDRLVSMAESRRILRDVEHARLVVLDRCGHLPMLERAGDFNHRLADFLREVEAAPLPSARRAASMA
jgi:pimeloyl-ACP methyl ester carboxylesterase